WLQAFRFEHENCGRAFQEQDERLRNLGCLAVGANSRGEFRHLCELSWQWPYQLRARHGHNLRGLSDADFSFALGDNVSSLSTWHENSPGFQLLANSKLIYDMREMDSTCPAFSRIRINNRFG